MLTACINQVVGLFQSAACAQLEDLCAALLKTLQTNTKSDAVPTEVPCPLVGCVCVR